MFHVAGSEPMLAELEAQVDSTKNLNHPTFSLQESRLLWTSKTPDEPAGDLHHRDQSRQCLGSVGFPPPSKCLPSPSHHNLLLKACQDMVLPRAWQVQANPLPPGEIPSDWKMSQVVLIIICFHRFLPPPQNVHQSRMVGQHRALCPSRPPSQPILLQAWQLWSWLGQEVAEVRDSLHFPQRGHNLKSCLLPIFLQEPLKHKRT